MADRATCFRCGKPVATDAERTLSRTLPKTTFALCWDGACSPPGGWPAKVAALEAEVERLRAELAMADRARIVSLMREDGFMEKRTAAEAWTTAAGKAEWLWSEIERLRARVEKLEAEVERLREECAAKDRYIADVTGRLQRQAMGRRAEVDRLLDRFRHRHAAGTLVGQDIDQCARCGMDIREPIHGEVTRDIVRDYDEKGRRARTTKLAAALACIRALAEVNLHNGVTDLDMAEIERLARAALAETDASTQPTEE